jgi:deazaflavin-dependent oxidoreductase (nitroreductase family)
LRLSLSLSALACESAINPMTSSVTFTSNQGNVCAKNGMHDVSVAAAAEFDLEMNETANDRTDLRDRVRVMRLPLPARLFIKAHAALYSLSNGKLASTMRGHPVLLLTTRGAKTGARRQVPVAPFVEGDDVYVIASLGGAPSNPAWFHNLKADPNVEVQRFADKYKAKARILPEPERTRVWQRVVAAMPGFSDYQKKTSRVIPVVQLERVQ